MQLTSSDALRVGEILVEVARDEIMPRFGRLNATLRECASRGGRHARLHLRPAVRNDHQPDGQAHDQPRQRPHDFIEWRQRREHEPRLTRNRVGGHVSSG